MDKKRALYFKNSREWLSKRDREGAYLTLERSAKKINSLKIPSNVAAIKSLTISKPTELVRIGRCYCSIGFDHCRLSEEFLGFPTALSGNDELLGLKVAYNTLIPHIEGDGLDTYNCVRLTETMLNNMKGGDRFSNLYLKDYCDNQVKCKYVFLFYKKIQKGRWAEAC